MAYSPGLFRISAPTLFFILITLTPGLAQIKPSSKPAAITTDSLPRGAISSERSFVIAAGGKSILFNPGAGIEHAFLNNVYRPFGFSPDSRYFLYLKAVGGLPTFQLYLYDLATGTERKITDDTVYNARWSPVSFRIAFMAMKSATEYRLYVVDTLFGEPYPVATGILDPDYLEWSQQGNNLYYSRMKPSGEDYFHNGEIESELHEFDLGLASDRTLQPEVAGGALDPPGYRRPTMKRTGMGDGYISVLEGQSSVVKKWNNRTNEYETLGRGHVYDTSHAGVVIREFSPAGVRFSLADSSGTVTPHHMFTSTWKLPFEGSADLNQGGGLFNGGGCDGRACNIVSHNNSLGYALDWQQRPNQGMGNTRILAAEEGTVAAVATNVTCNSINTTCQIGWDNYSPQCTNSNGGAGNYVVLAHADGSFSFYGHMRSGTSPLVIGETVVRGGYLGDQGHSGSTGNNNGNYNGCGDHIHYQRQTSPAVWAQSIPTDFSELPCVLSCQTNYTSQNVEASNTSAAQTLTIQLVPQSLSAGSSSPANRIILPAAAPAGGVTLALSSSSVDVTVPASLIVAEGQTYGTFTISAASGAAAGPVTVTAQDGSQTAMANLTIKAVGIVAVNLNPTTIIGGGQTTANEVVLTASVASGGAINLSSSSPLASVPSAVLVPAGGSFAPFSILTSSTSNSVYSTITATYGTFQKTNGVMIAPLNITSVSLISAAPIGGATVFGNRIYFNGTAPADAVINLSSSNPAAASVPPTVTLFGGATSVTFPITTYQVNAPTPATITASYNSSVRNAGLTVQATVPQSLTVGATTVAGGATVNGNKVTLNGPAAAGGAVVILSSSDPAVASVPASITVAAGATVSPTFPISTNTVASVATVTITATLNGVSRNVNLTVNPVGLNSITLGALSVTGGSSLSNNTVTLNGPAATGGITVGLLSSDPVVASVPSSITIASGSTVSAVFTITTTPVSVTTQVTITADLNGTLRTATLTINPTGLSSITLSASSALGGSTVTGNRIILNGPAPAGGISVALITSDSNVATVAANVTIPEGGTQATFPITTYTVTSATPVTITASFNGVSRSASLNLTPVALTTLALSSGSAVGGAYITGNRVTISGPAGPNGVIVALSTSNGGLATVGASVTVPAGATQATFPITTYYVASAATVTITASYNGVNRSANLNVNPVALLSVTLPSGSAVGGVQVTGTARLNGAAPASGVTVNLDTSDSTLATTALSVIVPAGATQATFPIATYHVSAAAGVTINAAYDGITRSVNLSLNPTAPASILVPSTSIVGGNLASGNRVTLNGPAAPGGSIVALTSSDPSVAAVPPNILLASGAVNSPLFDITTTQVAAPVSIVITATLNGVSRTMGMTIQPITPTSVALANNSVTGGTTVLGNRVYFNGPAAPGGSTIITLTSSDPSIASVPASVAAQAGTTSQTFQITTYTVTSTANVTITATINGVSRSKIMTVNP